MQQHDERVPAASRHLSANADSTVFLFGFRRSYLFTATLGCIIITDFANVLADMPMSCVGSSLLHEHRLRSHSVWNWGERKTLHHRIAVPL